MTMKRIAMRLCVLLLFFTAMVAMAQDVPGRCPCPDNSDPVAVVRCILNAEMPGLGLCKVNQAEGYPALPTYDHRRPNVFRGYRVVSVADGKPYHGQPTKVIKIEYDYVAKHSELHPEGRPLCKVLSQAITTYKTDRGWLVGINSDSNLKSWLVSDRLLLEKAFANRNVSGIKELSTRINALENAAKTCPMPEGEWK